MSTPAENLLGRLSGIRQRAPNRWDALCPGHDDHNPSLGIEETDDGTLLVNCRAGCATADALAVISMTLADLFPRRFEHKGKRRPTFTARDVIETLDHESLVVMVIAADILAGRSVSSDDLERVATARRRIDRIRGIARA